MTGDRPSEKEPQTPAHNSAAVGLQVTADAQRPPTPLLRSWAEPRLQQGNGASLAPAGARKPLQPQQQQHPDGIRSL